MSQLSTGHQIAMDYFVFAKIKGYYLLLEDDRTPDTMTASNSLFFSASNLEPVLCAKTVAADSLYEIFGTDINFSQSQYSVSSVDNYLLLIPLSSLNTMFKGRQLELASIDAKQRVTEFELATKEGLIKALYTTNTSLGEHVKAWADYFFSDHFSLWIYNKYTKAFTCSISSFDSPRNFIFESEDQSLNDVLATDYEAECRAPNQDWVVLTKSPDIKTINRMKLVLGFDGTIGVLTFYSRHEDFALRPKNYSEISNSIERKYLQDSQRAQHAVHEINRRFIETYEAGKLNEFLYNIVYQVTQSFQVEACSIFLVDGIREHLELIASHDNHTQGKPQDQYSYLVTDKTPSAEVYRTGEMAFSYNLAVDDPNNEGYNESTDHVPTNWIGAPLISAGTCFGVLRVRNKFERGENNESSITNFHSDDFRNLLSLCSNLSNLIKLESLFIETETRLENTNASMVEMNDFNKVFLHEIRTPISKFTMAPEIIKRTLGRKDLSQSNLDKVMKQLDDIQVMGDRLGFIAKTFNFDQIVTRRHFETLSVLRDIVFPVINITRAYLRKQYDIDIDLNSTGLQSSRVYGDKTLLNIVFNTLIDNAGKYSVGTRRPINVSGSYYGRGDHFDIVVSNYGLEIHEDEVANLFEKGVRGREVIKHGIGGTGIGLHLAQRIMSEGEGDLLLTSIKDPVSFTIRIPVREKGARA